MHSRPHGSPARLTTIGALLTAALIAAAPESHAVTAPDLRSRITINGDAGDFEASESIFGPNGAHVSIEPGADSQWLSNDVSGIRVTWDRRHLYVAGEGVLWGNNMLLFIDLVQDQGLGDMTSLNSWRRNIGFPADFAPDVFLGTWDTFPSARLLLQLTGSQVDDQPPGALFVAASSFFQGASPRCVEARIPWTTIFRYSSHGSVVVRDTVIGGEPDTLAFLPPGAQLRIAAAITPGWDGGGGPDVAPDNSTGCSSDGASLLQVDNYAIVDLDADSDGLPDMNVEPVTRVGFKYAALPAQRTTWGKLKVAFH